MTARTTENSLFKRRVARKAAVVALAVVGLVGVSATAAQASTQLLGNNYLTADEANGELRGLEDQCYNINKGVVEKAEVHYFDQQVGTDENGNKIYTRLYYGWVQCSK